MGNMSQILIILNHNTIMAESVSTKEKRIYINKGIGFNKSVGDYFEVEDEIERNLLVLEGDQINDYESLLSRVYTKDLIDVIQIIISEANEEFDYKINPNLHITLLDHINFAFERNQQGIDINYPFLDEISILYPREYKFAEQALRKINKIFDKSLLDSEIAFITLHIHAALTEKTTPEVLEFAQIRHEVTNIIESSTGKNLIILIVYTEDFYLI